MSQVMTPTRLRRMELPNLATHSRRAELIELHRELTKVRRLMKKLAFDLERDSTYALSTHFENKWIREHKKRDIQELATMEEEILWEVWEIYNDGE